MTLLINKHISHSIFTHGEQFHSAYYKIIDDNNAPAFVCLAFSIEIFLKSLKAEKHYKEKNEGYYGVISYEDIYDKSLLRGHKLLDLFSGIDTNLRTEIIQRYKQKHNTNFQEDLKNINTVFEDWRYIYEGNTFILHKSTLEDVSEFLHSYIKEKLSIN